MNLIHNNYLRSSGNGTSWSVEIDPPSRLVKSYFDETIVAAEMIWAQKQGTMYLCYSGGLDSEYALSVFRHLGMPVIPAIMRTQYNNHETQYAFKYCQNHNIEPLVIDLDYDDFVKSGQLLEIATAIKCSTWQVPSNMWLCSQLDGTVITGDSPPHLKKKDDVWFVDEEEYVYSQLTYFKNFGIHGTPFILNHTAEQMLSFLLDPTTQLLGNDQILGKLGNNSTKVHVYNNNDFFQLEQRVKQHGYEKVEKNLIFEHPDIQTVISTKEQWGGTSNHQFHKIVSDLLLGRTSTVSNKEEQHVQRSLEDF